MPEVDGYRHVAGRGICAVRVQRLGLERQHLGLVDLVDHAAVVPWQPPRPGVEPGGEDHRLLDAARSRGDEEFVEPLGAGCGVSRNGADPLGHVTLRQFPAARDGLFDEHLRVRVGVQRALRRRLLRPRPRHAQCGRADAFGDVPGVVVSSGHSCRLRCILLGSALAPVLARSSLRSSLPLAFGVLV